MNWIVFAISLIWLRKTTSLPKLKFQETLLKNIPYFCFDNTVVDQTLTMNCNEPWRSLGPKCGMDRALDTGRNEVIYVHLARGAEKTFNRYHKPGKVYMSGWEQLCKHVLEIDNV